MPGGSGGRIGEAHGAEGPLGGLHEAGGGEGQVGGERGTELVGLGTLVGTRGAVGVRQGTCRVPARTMPPAYALISTPSRAAIGTARRPARPAAVPSTRGGRRLLAPGNVRRALLLVRHPEGMGDLQIAGRELIQPPLLALQSCGKFVGAPRGRAGQSVSDDPQGQRKPVRRVRGRESRAALHRQAPPTSAVFRMGCRMPESRASGTPGAGSYTASVSPWTRSGRRTRLLGHQGSGTPSSACPRPRRNSPDLLLSWILARVWRSAGRHGRGLREWRRHEVRRCPDRGTGGEGSDSETARDVRRLDR